MDSRNNLMGMYKEGRLVEVTTIWESVQDADSFDEWDYIAMMP